MPSLSVSAFVGSVGRSGDQREKYVLFETAPSGRFAAANLHHARCSTRLTVQDAALYEPSGIA